MVVLVPNVATPVARTLARWFDPHALAAHRLDIMSPAAIRRAMELAGFDEVRVGSCGNPTIYGTSARRNWLGRAHEQFARVWNIVTGVIPFNVLWHGQIWGTGRLPRERCGPEPCKSCRERDETTQEDDSFLDD